MNRKTGIIKGIIAIAICCVMVFQTSTYSEAALLRYSVRYDDCKRCGARNKSYGFDEHWSWEGRYAYAGNRCPVCGQVVAAGERHSYQQEKERYYYICESSDCEHLNYSQRKYHYDYLKSVYSDHRVSKVSN